MSVSLTRRFGCYLSVQGGREERWAAGVDGEVEEDVARVHEGVGQLDHEEAGAELTAAAVVPDGSGNQEFAREKSVKAGERTRCQQGGQLALRGGAGFREPRCQRRVCNKSSRRGNNQRSWTG